MITLREPAFRLLALLPLALLSGAACGGKSFNADGYGNGGSGSAGVSGSGVAGNAAAGSGAGGAGSAGAGTGGSSVGGTTNAGASSGGVANGGTSNGGTANGGGSGGSNTHSCVQNTDCIIEAVSCCSCGSGPISDYTAINSKYVNQYNPNCNGIACGPCPPTANDPNDPRLYYVPTCVSLLTVGDKVVHECRVLDIRNETNITSCASDADCMLRGGTACCPGCGTQAVAINASKESELESLVCPMEAFGCAECAPNEGELGVTCISGQCSVGSPCSAQNPCTL